MANIHNIHQIAFYFFPNNGKNSPNFFFSICGCNSGLIAIFNNISKRSAKRYKQIIFMASLLACAQVANNFNYVVPFV